MMGNFDEYLERAKDLAEDAGEAARNVAGEVADRAKELMDEGGKARELMRNAKDQTTAAAASAKEKVHGMLQDARAVKEIKLGIIELEAMQEVEGSILYKMELETMLNYLNNLLLIIQDGRLNDESVVEEIREVMGKVQPFAEPQAEDAAAERTEEDLAIEKAKTVTFSACRRALEQIFSEQ